MRESLDGEDGSEGSRADEADSIESVLESAEDTETVVEKLRESGTRYHVSESNVDDVIDSIGSTEDGDTDPDPFTLDGGPTRTVSSEGIDEVFEKLEAEVDDRDEEPIGTSATTERRPEDGEPSPFAAAAEEPDFEELKREYGSLSGRPPAKTVSDESVDDILALASGDDGRATADGDGETADSATARRSPSRRSPAGGSSGQDDVANGAGDRSPSGTAVEAIRPDDPEAAMTSLLDDAAAPDRSEPADESTGE
ncbi:hypothetical protein [Halosolutus halophilus]|uniref:hypothetical protein n=1 Tax=Halosolutus halophilus TaxID=1552990 RepID=UPI00223503AC|nr:hypothetical protein [Halosolutus halophilus]